MRIYFLLFLSVVFNLSVWAHNDNGRNGNGAPIVIVSSYNPDVRSMSDNISAFYDGFTKSGLSNPIVVVDINAKNMPDGIYWRGRLTQALQKFYAGGKRPACIVLLGVEASSSFFSLDDNEELKKTPVVVGVQSSAVVKLPKGTFDCKEWNPVAYDITKDFKDYNIVGGEVYHYDVKKNLDLIKHFYPECDTLTFMSDNTLGGVTMQALFRKYVQTDTRFHVQYIDGRTASFVDADKAIASMSQTQSILIGTWRVDNSNSYVVRNTTYTFRQNNPQLPTFSLSEVSLGHWMVGGYSPCYHIMGKQLSDYVVSFLQTGEKKAVSLVNNRYVFDYDRLNDLDLSLNNFNSKYDLVNEPANLVEQYFGVIIMVVMAFIILLTVLIVLLYILKRDKVLQKRLLKMSKELLVAKHNAEQANLMKSHFIANISHEIRTPLHAVLGFAQIFTNNEIELTAEEKKQYGDLILTNGDLLLKLVDDVLDISKIDAGKMRFEIEEHDVVELIHVAVKSVLADIRPEVSVHVHTHHIHHLTLLTDKQRFLQVLTNLLTNAKKVTESGTISVYLDKLPSENMIRVSVCDTGCGIPADKADAIFERFKKLDEFKQGTGLGLPICKAIIEELGGTIWLDTDYTEGARFVFTHPM